MLLVRSTPEAHKTPLYQLEIKIEGRSAAWKSQTMIVMLKDDLNTYFAYSEIEMNFNNLESTTRYIYAV